MAKALAKKVAADNEKALQSLLFGTIIASFLYVVLRLVLPWKTFPPTRGQLAIFGLTAIPQLLLTRYLNVIGTPKRDGAGNIISTGEDLYQAGLTDYMWDIIYVTWLCQIGSSLIGEKFWWLYLSIPLYGVYKIYTVFIGPMMAARRSAGGVTEPTTDEEPASKRQAKMQKRNDKAQAKAGRR